MHQVVEICFENSRDADTDAPRPTGPKPEGRDQHFEERFFETPGKRLSKAMSEALLQIIHSLDSDLLGASFHNHMRLLKNSGTQSSFLLGDES